MEALPGPPLRIAVLGDFDGPHTRRWLRVFIDRGHDVHAISFYRPREPLPGATLHVLRPGRSTGGGSAAPSFASLVSKTLAPELARGLHAWRYRRAGLRALLDAIAPDVFHAHYVVEHGFYGAVVDFHPYVVSAWGSDLLVESHQPAGQLIARYALRHADFVTTNDASMARRAVELGVKRDRVETVRLGIDADFFSAAPSVNLAASDDVAPVLISDRALEPIYNVETILRAFAALRTSIPAARLIIANDGIERSLLETLTKELGLSDSVRFAGKLSPLALRGELAGGHIYISVPRSDSFALSNLEAMACGAFPILSKLPSVEGMVEDGHTTLLVKPGDVVSLTTALLRACGDAALRRDAVAPNRVRAEKEGNLERNMLAVERAYYRLAKRPMEHAARP